MTSGGDNFNDIPENQLNKTQNISYFLNIRRHLPYVYLNANRMLWTYFPTFVDLVPTPCKWTLFPSGRYFRGHFFQPWTFFSVAVFSVDLFSEHR